MTWDIAGKVVAVTGANSGIGRAAALQLAIRGATVILICRSRERGDAARRSILAAANSERVDLRLCDLASQAQIRNLAAGLRADYPALHVLLNNAATVPPRRKVSPDGIELQLAVNHLAPFLVTRLLLDRLEAAAQQAGEARVIVVSSRAHRGVSVNFADLQNKRAYFALSVYGQTKLMNVLFTNELARRTQGTRITANSLHPGFVRTGLGRAAPLLNVMAGFLAVSPEKGAETPVYLAASPQVTGVTGAYFVDRRPVAPSRAALDRGTAQALWQRSAELVGL
ncbi:MAG: SDR family oxidoreductase [Chloroflexi bacterium]|nr:SDR family oxidoreductase [Chloroflexota bacterium]